MKRQSLNDRLLLTALVLFLIEILLLPVCLKFTYADASDTPAGVLTYTNGKLTWDSAVSVLPDGTAELNFFDDGYTNVISVDGKNVLAPGTGAVRKIRLISAVPRDVAYRALIYRIDSEQEIPIKGILDGPGSGDTGHIPALPEGVAPENVLKTMEGTLPGNDALDFNVGWEWLFYESQARDAADTLLGNDEAAKTTLGFYLVIDDDTAVVPPSPQTGDDAPVKAYIALIVISFLVLLLLFVTRERDRKAKRAKKI